MIHIYKEHNHKSKYFCESIKVGKFHCFFFLLQYEVLFYLKNKFKKISFKNNCFMNCNRNIEYLNFIHFQKFCLEWNKQKLINGILFKKN